jgi:hypothetical protein
MLPTRPKPTPAQNQKSQGNKNRQKPLEKGLFIYRIAHLDVPSLEEIAEKK